MKNRHMAYKSARTIGGKARHNGRCKRMKTRTRIVHVVFAGLALACQCPASDGTDLLLDTFNRIDASDIDAQTNGMSGSLMSLLGPGAVYYEGSGSPDNIQVRNGALRMAVGGGLSENGLMCNFTNQAILDAAGFTVEMDVKGINGIPALDSYAGFGVGLTDAQVSAGGGTVFSNSFRDAGFYITDAVDASNGWTLAGGVGNFLLQDVAPTAGDSYFSFSVSPGTAEIPGNRAVVKDLGVVLHAGSTYTVTGDFNQSLLNRPFIGDAFATATSDQVAFGFFATNGINFASNSNSERRKIRDAINAILLDADSNGVLEWNGRAIPTNGTWQTWSYTFTVPAGSAFDGAAVWFGTYGGHTDFGDIQNSLAFDNLRIGYASADVDGGSDFFTELDMDGNVKVWGRGSLLETIPVGVSTGRLTAAFSLDGFSSNSPVRASVYFNGNQLDINTADSTSQTRTFFWRRDLCNHIGLAAQASDSVEIDNFAIRTFPLGRTLAGGYAEQAGLSGDDASPDADPDGDGRSNYQEWLIGSNPAVADESNRAISLLSVPVSGDNIRFSIRRLSNASGAGIDYIVYASTDLQQWVPVSPEEIGIAPLSDPPGYEQVEFQLAPPAPGLDRLFLMVRYVPLAQATGANTPANTAKVYPFDYFGSTVEYVGYDIKQDGKAAKLTASLAGKLFGTDQDNMNLLRVPIYGNAGHPSDGSVAASVYADTVDAMTLSKAARPDIRFFANLKIYSTEPWYPAWVTNTDGSFMPESYARLLADYLQYMKDQGVPIDFLGISCEPENAGGYNYSNVNHSACIAELRSLSTNTVAGFDFAMPIIVGPCSINPTYGTDNEGNEKAAEFLKRLREAGMGDTLDIASTHYYHDWRSVNMLKIFDAEANALGVSKWQSEVHWNNDTNLVDDAEHALGALWDCTDLGFKGFVWWAYSRSDSGTGNKGRIFQQLNHTMTYCRPVGMDDPDGPSLEPGHGYFMSRAFRMQNSNIMHVWVVNNSAASYTDFRFDLASATLNGQVDVNQWIGETQTDSTTGQNGDSYFYTDIPANSIVQCTFEIN